MQIVIDIDENLYIKLFGDGVYNAVDMLKICASVRKGKVLPKGHGRLIDADALELDYDWYEYMTSTGQLMTIGYQAYSLSQIENTNTIIEADRGIK